MIIVTAYHMDNDENKEIKYVLADEELVCPACRGTALIGKGWRKRKLIKGNETVLTMNIHRIRCKDCNKMHHVLPDIIVPYKRHDSGNIDKVTENILSESIYDESTINRIKAWWRKILLYLAAFELNKSEIEIPLKPTVKQVVCILVNANLWPRTHTALDVG